MSQDDDVRLSPELIAQLTALASRLTAQGEYDACDLIDTVVARVTEMPQRELLADMSDDAALKLSADIYDGMLSEPSSPQSKLSGSFEAETEFSAAPGAVEEIRDHSRELLAEALEALDGMLFFVGELPGAQYSAHVHAARAAADKIRAALEPQP